MEEEDDEEEERENERECRRVARKKEAIVEDVERDEILYGKRSVRARRKVNYQFKEYDELIFSAIGGDVVESGMYEQRFFILCNVLLFSIMLAKLNSNFCLFD